MASQVSKITLKSGMSGICQLFVKAFQSWPHLLSSTASLDLEPYCYIFIECAVWPERSTMRKYRQRGGVSADADTTTLLVIIKSLSIF